MRSLACLPTWRAVTVAAALFTSSHPPDSSRCRFISLRPSRRQIPRIQPIMLEHKPRFECRGRFRAGMLMNYCQVPMNSGNSSALLAHPSLTTAKLRRKPGSSQS